MARRPRHRRDAPQPPPPPRPSWGGPSAPHATPATASTRRVPAAYAHGLAWYPSSTAFLLSHLLHWGAFEPNGKTPSTASCAGWTGLGAREKNLFNSRLGISVHLCYIAIV